jgi:tape measure domain-containing protein
MATIDDKVVAMSFESAKFESGVNRALTSLDKLKAALHFPNAGKGLNDINAAAKNVNLGHISQGVEGVKKALESLRLIAIGVMSQLTAQAVRAGGRFVKAFTLDPLKAGFQEYSTNLNAVQTILANTQAAGVGLKEVNATLKELNEYSDKTIYNFGQMAKNIGTFTAAGVELKTATASIKGIANLAALSGSNAEQASTAMYQLSQAIAAGSVKLQDWNSVVNAGMGGTVFQRALAQTAEAMGTLEKGTVKLTGPMKNVTIAGEAFRQSLSTPGKASWLTSEVLTKTLKQFTGDLKDAELAAMGFNDAQIKSIQQTAKTAMFAATEVKTIAQVFDVAKETAASGWAATFQIIFGTFTEAKKTFTEMSNAINGFINASADARNKVLGDWKALGGRTVLIDSIRTAFRNLGLIMAPIKEAFRDIFPATTGKNLYDLTLRFRDFANALKPSATTVDGLKRTFRGLFALLSIGAQLVKGIFTVFAQLFGAVGEGSGSFLNFTGNIGDFLVSVDAALKKGNRLHNFFVTIGQVLRKPIELISAFATALTDLFSGFSPGGISDSMGGLTDAMGPLEKIMSTLSTTWDKFTDAVANSGKVLRPMIEAMAEAMSGLGVALGNAASNINFEAILAVIRTGLLVGLTVMFKKFLGKGSLMEQLGGAGGGILGNISGSFKALEGSMQSLQTNIKAKTLKEIAIAIALLTASVVALSFVDPEKLKSSLTAMTVAFGQLLGAMAILGNISKSLGFIKMPVIAAALILLAGAITILSAAVVILAQLSWSELARGLGGVVVLLGAVSAAVIPLSANSSGMVRAGIGIMAIAVAMNLLALAVRQFASMSLTELGKGLGAVAVGLGIIAASMKLMPTGSMVIAGAGLIAVATGLNILAFAIEKLGGMNWKVLGKGMAAVAGSLVAIALAMKLMPKSMLITGAGLLLVAVALQGIARAVEKMGGMSIREIAKGLGTLAGSLIILAVALHAMSGAIGGALALGIAAAGLALLAPALVLLGKQSWEEILKGLVTLAAALTILGIAGLLIGPVVPALLGLGAALLLIGAGLALAGAGIFLIATGLSALVVAAPTGVGVIVAAFVALQEGVLKNIKFLILGLLEIVEAFAATAPKFAVALGKILSSLLDTIIDIAPKIGEAISALLKMILQVFNDNRGNLVQSGMNLLLDLLKGVRNNIGQIVTVVSDIIVKFLNSLSNNANKIVTAGVNLLKALMKGVVNQIGSVATTVLSIITRFLSAIASNLGRIATAGLSILVRLLQAIASNLGRAISAGTDIIVSFVKGIGNAAGRIVTAARQSAGKFINTLATQIVALADQVATALITLIHGMATVIENRAPELRGAAIHLGKAIISGLTSGVTSAAGDLYAKISSVMDHAMSLVKKIPLIGSPSKVTTEIGEWIVLGLVKGMENTETDLYSSATAISNGVIGTFNDVFETASPSKVMYNIGQFVGQGFANGLLGSTEDIRASFGKLKERLKEDIVGVREDMAAEQDRLAEMLAAKQEKLDDINAKKWKKQSEKAKAIADVQEQYAKSIKESEDAIKQSDATLKRLTVTQKVLNKSLQDEKSELIKLATEFEKVNEKLKQAQDELKAIIKERDDFAKSQADKYAAPPEISEPMVEEIKSAREKIAEEQKKLDELLVESVQDLEKITDARASLAGAQGELDKLVEGKVLTGDGSSVDVVATYLQDLAAQEKAVAAYGATLAALRGMRLDEKTYRMLVEEGVAAQGFAEALLAGGKTAVKSVNKLDTDINTEANKLGVSSAEYLYAAGVASAEGFVKGFEKDRAKLLKVIRKLGLDIVKELKKALGIKSPSEEFAKIGAFTMEGMAKGIEDSSKQVSKAVDQAAQDALAAMRNTMTRISGAVAEEISDPVITPILDLSTVRTQAAELDKLTNTATASYGQAAIISSQRSTAELEAAAAVAVGPSVTYEQNNYSPKALTEVEIYRQTKNQLSQLKSVLAVT